MTVLVIAAGVLTLATLLLSLLWRLGLALLRRPAPRYWRRTLLWHAGLFALHLFVTVPLLIGYLAPGLVGTRPDERAYSGPRLAADGSWMLQSRESLAAEQAEVEGGAAPRHAAPLPPLELQASDGVRLRAFLVPPAQEPPRFVALMVHGLYRNALELETVASWLRELGGEVLLVELRNHGGSDHAPATFGLDESLDVLAGAEFLRRRPEAANRPLIVFAVSLGTAAASLAAPRIPDLSGLILDAPMDDLEATAARELGGGPVGVPQPWSGLLLWSLRHLAGVPLGRVEPGAELARLSPDVELLLIGAGRDTRMPPATVTALFESLPTPPAHKTLWIEPDATHGKVWVAAPEEYRRRLARFCDAVAGPRATGGDS